MGGGIHHRGLHALHAFRLFTESVQIGKGLGRYTHLDLVDHIQPPGNLAAKRFGNRFFLIVRRAWFAKYQQDVVDIGNPRFLVLSNVRLLV